MPSATIIAAKVFPPKAGKKRGTIVTPDEVLYGAMPPILNKVQPGGAYDIEYKEDHFQGKTYLVIEQISPAKNQPQAPAPSAGPSQQARYGVTDDKKSEQIFVCGAINATLGNAAVDPKNVSAGELLELVNRLRYAWANSFGKPKSPDMGGDEIPFE